MDDILWYNKFLKNMGRHWSCSLCSELEEPYRNDA